MNILLVDDDINILDILSSYIKKEGYTVFSLNDGSNVISSIKRHNIDLVVLDIMLPVKSGYTLTTEIRNDSCISDLPIIMLTAKDDDSEKIIGLDIGADDYITKPFNGRVVVARINSILRRTNSIEKYDPIIKMSDITLNKNKYELFVNGIEKKITVTEFKILLLLIENPGYTFTREELLEKSMGYGYEGLGRSLDTHIKNIRNKVDQSNNKDESYIKTLYGLGYRFNEKNKK